MFRGSLRIVTTAASLAAMVAFTGASAAVASDNASSASSSSVAVQQNEMDALVRRVQLYISIHDGIPYFDMLAAKAAGESTEVLQVGSTLNPGTIRSISAVSATGPTTPFGITLPAVYGRWCGPRASGPGDPIDALDRACKTHDLCYGSKGYFNRDCDIALMRTIARDYKSYSWKTKVFAAAFYATFYVRLNGVKIVGVIPPGSLGK